MVTVYGMNDKVGNVSYYDPNADQTFTKPYSEETGKMIDEEVRKLIDQAYQRTKQLLLEKKEQVEKLAKALLNREVLFQSDVEELIGKRPFELKSPIHIVDENPAPHAHAATEIGAAETTTATAEKPAENTQPESEPAQESQSPMKENES
jgi:cell division protease FtsH